MSKAYALKSRVWISRNDETYLGLGRVDLLREIHKYGSINRAAKAMSMSYKKAWSMVDSMNRLGPEPLVISKNGGSKGGGSQLSVYGEKIIQEFDQLMEEQRVFLEEKMKSFAL